MEDFQKGLSKEKNKLEVKLIYQKEELDNIGQRWAQDKVNMAKKN